MCFWRKTPAPVLFRLYSLLVARCLLSCCCCSSAVHIYTSLSFFSSFWLTRWCVCRVSSFFLLQFVLFTIREMKTVEMTMKKEEIFMKMYVDERKIFVCPFWAECASCRWRWWRCCWWRREKRAVQERMWMWERMRKRRTGKELKIWRLEKKHNYGAKNDKIKSLYVRLNTFSSFSSLLYEKTKRYFFMCFGKWMMMMWSGKEWKLNREVDARFFGKGSKK